MFYAVARDTTARKATEQNLQRFGTDLKHLHRINTTQYQGFAQLFAECIETGCQILYLDTGIISQITGHTYTIRSVQAVLDSLAANQEFHLANTYCAAVVRDHKTVTYQHVGQMDDMQNHPVYQTLCLESYLGTPSWGNGEIYGTLNFSSTTV